MNAVKLTRVQLILGSTKIFKQTPSSPPTIQRMNVRIHANSSFLLLPDPVQPFANSNYIQHQIFELEDTIDNTSSIVILDWVTEGRAARNEHWDLSRFESRNEIYAVRDEGGTKVRDKLLLRDAMMLDGTSVEGEETLRERQDGQAIFATAVIRGKAFDQLVDYITKRYKNEPRIGAKKWDTDDDSRGLTRVDIDARKGGVWWTTSSVRGFLLVKVSGVDVEAVKRFIRGLLGEANGDGILSPDGCITREFGTGMFRCIE